MIGALARRSITARLGRNLFILLAVTIGVSFVSGSFVLADSMRTTFDKIFDDVGGVSDLIVRTRLQEGADPDERSKYPVPATLVDTVARVEGVASAKGWYQRSIVIIDENNKPILTGPPMLGFTYLTPLPEGYSLEGTAPEGPKQAVLDAEAAETHDYKIGDTITVVTPAGLFNFTLTGTLRSPAPSGGAVILYLDPAVAGEIYGLPDAFDDVRVNVAERADTDQVQQRIREVIPDNLEVITSKQEAEELKGQIGQLITGFSTALLIFAVITAFVSAFIINNIFGITVGQRLRELALLRAIGASKRQVRRLILLEAVAGALIGTIAGILGGIMVAKGLIALLNALGAGFPDFGTVLKVRTIIVSIIVGVGTVSVAALVPAWRASRIPPVAAMRPELGFGALSASRRLIGGIVVTAAGIALFLLGLFARPGGTSGLIAFAGAGAVLTFLGVTSLSTTVAAPVSRLVGWPLAKLFGVSGELARDNAARSPRRTARTASALTIGTAVISIAATLASSISTDFDNALNSGITADYFVTSVTQQVGIPPRVATELRDLPETAVAASVRVVNNVRVSAGGQQRSTSVSGIDPATVDQVLGLRPLVGTPADLGDDGVALFEPTAKEWAVSVGDTVTLRFSDGTSVSAPVRMIFRDNSTGSTFVVPLELLRANQPGPAEAVIVLVRKADGVDNTAARAAIDGVLRNHPLVQVQDNAELRAEVRGQINQLLYTITVLLSFAIALAFFGIAVTLAMSVIERIREIGLLRAVGMTRRQLRRSIRWESVIVAIFGVVIGTVVGVGMGLAVVTAVPDNIISSLSLPWGTITFVVLFAVILALLSAWYPARKAARLDVLEAISHS